ncbi:hypothetical protein BHM03_00033616 [Ensete ventricosum]|nr:hypothetical protein BHM03_00033616 [Ensete ventricosum]
MICNIEIFFLLSETPEVIPSGKGKEPVVIEEAPERGYTLRELCEVEDRVGAERYLATVMTQLKVVEGEDLLMPRWSAIAGSNQFWTEGPLSGEYLHGALHPTLAKQAYECSFVELMNRASKSAVWSNLEKMGWVNYKFGYWEALERLRGKHPEIEVEQDLFVECPEDANIKMDLSQPFNVLPNRRTKDWDRKKNAKIDKTTIGREANRRWWLKL